jgi:hypothetical protein
MRGKIVSAAAALAFCLAAAPAVAHHAFAAEFDAEKPIKLTGKVVEMRWSNPHAWIYLDVAGADLPAGTVLVIQGWQARNGSNTANAGAITFPDGRRLFAGSSNPNAERELK